MAAYCVSIFGDMLLDKPLDDFPVSNCPIFVSLAENKQLLDEVEHDIMNYQS